MKKWALLFITLITVFSACSAQADLEKSLLLDRALSALEKGNVFLERYNELTSSHVEALFELGIPYLFGGVENGGVFGRQPEYSKRLCWQDSNFFHEGQLYINGFDCAGFTQWVYRKCGLPPHDTLSNLILNYGEHGHDYIYSHRDGQQMDAFDKLKDKLQPGDLFITKHPYSTYRHIMMYIGTPRDFGFTQENEPALGPYLDYPLVIHCSTHPQFGERFQRFIDEHPEEYGRCSTTDGGVQVSILGVPLDDAPYHIHVQNTDFHYFILSSGTWMTAYDVFDLSSYCWYRIPR